MQFRKRTLTFSNFSRFKTWTHFRSSATSRTFSEHVSFSNVHTCCENLLNPSQFRRTYLPIFPEFGFHGNTWITEKTIYGSSLLVTYSRKLYRSFANLGYHFYLKLLQQCMEGKKEKYTFMKKLRTNEGTLEGSLEKNERFDGKLRTSSFWC